MPFLVCIGPNSGHLQQRPNPFIVTTSLSSNTLKTYTFAVLKFQEFCHSFGISTTPSLHSVINFIAWMSLKGYKPSTVVAYIAGISYYLNLNGLSDVNEVFIVRNMFKGLQRSQPSKDIRSPVTIDMLKAILRALRNVATSDYEALLFSAAFVVMFFWLFQGRRDSY